MDRKIVEDYLNYDSEEEREKAEQEKLRRIQAKKNYYKKLQQKKQGKSPKKSPVKKGVGDAIDDGFGHQITVIDVDGMYNIILQFIS